MKTKESGLCPARPAQRPSHAPLSHWPHSHSDRRRLHRRRRSRRVVAAVAALSRTVGRWCSRATATVLAGPPRMTPARTPLHCASAARMTLARTPLHCASAIAHECEWQPHLPPATGFFRTAAKRSPRDRGSPPRSVSLLTIVRKKAKPCLSRRIRQLADSTHRSVPHRAPSPTHPPSLTWRTAPATTQPPGSRASQAPSPQEPGRHPPPPSL